MAIAYVAHNLRRSEVGGELPATSTVEDTKSESRTREIFPIVKHIAAYTAYHDEWHSLVDKL